MFRSIRRIFLIMSCSSCQTGEQSQISVQHEPPSLFKQEITSNHPPDPVSATTLIPDQFSMTLPELNPSSHRTIPKSMLALSEIVRPKAELREGPGPEFMLRDMILSQGTKVFVFSSHGVWRKILIPKTWTKGWVHYQALSPIRLNDKPLAFDMNQLPTVLALRNVIKAKTFPDQKEIAIKIPKGSMFRAFMESEWGTLVWLVDTNSALWIARKDVR